MSISLVCTTYNDENEICSLIQDICNQTVLPDEFIIADGGSNDNTVKLISDIASRAPFTVKTIVGKRLNISEGLNTAIRHSSGEYIGTGNHYDIHYLERLISIFLKDENVEVVFPPIRGLKTTKFSALYINAFLKGESGNCIPSNHGGLIKRNVFKANGLFYENFVYAGEDAEFYERLKNNNVKMSCAENAYVWWDVPHDYRSFRKQVKNYTIAAMQIEPLKKICHRYNQLIISLLSIIFGVNLLLTKKKKFGCAVIGVVLFYHLMLGKKNGFSNYGLKQYRKINQVFSLIHNRKYFSDCYSVDMKKIEYLD